MKSLSGSTLISRRGFLEGAAALAIAPSTLHASKSKGARSTGARTKPGRRFAYVGTYTINSADGKGNGKGIYLFEMDSQTGALSLRKLAAESANPSWLALHPSGKYLYAANEIADFEGGNGAVSAFSVDRSSGDLRLLNMVSSQGKGSAHLSVDHAGKYVFVANYASGSIGVLPIENNGALGAATDTRRDTGSVGRELPTNAPPGSFARSGHDAPHAHMILADPNDRFVLQTDLGQDRIYVYDFDQKRGKLTPARAPFASLPSGDGPRHLAFHPNGRWLYSIQEEASTVVFFHYDPATGGLAEQQMVSTLPKGFAGTNFPSEILAAANGRFLYAANRLHNTIAVFSIDGSGRLKHLEEAWIQGDYPRHLATDPDGNFLYVSSQRSDAITSFHIHSETGLLAFTGQYTPVGSPACTVFL